ncbi:ANTAR domain-containing protein [Streptomyces cellulosae]|uniref:ANTAR domain-containing protein n=1 Tax=Streptomyces cellulosae TaxID=1968 RepID=UPI000AC24458
MTGVLLNTDDDLGALNPYTHRPGTFGKDIETAGRLLAPHAAVALADARTIDQFQHAMDTRHPIGEAMGILVARHQCSEDDTFNVLRDVAQRVRAERTEST